MGGELKIKLFEEDGSIYVKGFHEGKWITMFKNPRMVMSGYIKRFHYEGEQLVVDEATIDQYNVVPEPIR